MSEGQDVRCWALAKLPRHVPACCLLVGLLGCGRSVVAYNDATQGVRSQHIACRETRACAVRSDGSFWCWGEIRHHSGQSVPERMLGFGEINAISMGPAGDCVVGHGALWCRQFDLLLDGGTEEVSGLVDLRGLVVVDVRSSDNDVCAIDQQRTAHCWGWNAYGQDDPGRPPYWIDPPGAVTAAAVDSFAAGGGFICVVTGGDLRCWGANDSGQCGAPPPSTVSQPSVLLRAVDSVAAGESGACAVMRDGTVSCWGWLNLLRDPSVSQWQPTAVPGLSAITSVSLDYDGCALDRFGSVRCWSVPGRQSPSIVRDLSDAIEVCTGTGHSCALRSNGAIVCWGRNNVGQLGDGTFEDSEVPVRVRFPE